MMIFTHTVFSVGLGALLASLEPMYAGQIIGFTLLAGIFPDLDMFFEHRKTFHRPFQFSALFLLLIPFYLFTGAFYLFILLAVLVSMVSHCALDLLSNGKTARPRENPDSRAVYDHIRGEWLKPRRMVLDGSKGDVLMLLLTGFTAFYLLYSTVFRIIVLGSVLAGVLYSVLMSHYRDYLVGDFDRFSEEIQYLLGVGPEVSEK
ncbi:MAG: hypothetical protein ACI8Z7_000590 [Candidatus Nanohaloarchaea archaeon]|jgi:hypothetical protein